MAIPISYNVRSLLQRPLSTATTAVGVGLTVAIFIGSLALAAGFQAALKRSGSSQNAIILRKGADSELTSGVTLDAASILRAHPEVAIGPDGRAMASADMVVLTNQPRLGQAGSSNVTVRGVDAAFERFRPEVKIVDGRRFAPGSDEIIASRRIARRFAGFAIGDRVTFGQRTFNVVGHFDAAGSAYDSEVWGDHTVLMPALGRQGAFSSVTVRLRDPERFDAVKADLERDPRLGIQVQREDQYYANQSELLANVIRVMGTLITVIMAFGAMFGAMNTMYAAVGARTREIATLLVLGFSPIAIMLSFMIESVCLALIGGVVGCLLALPINGIVTSTTNFSTFSELAFAFRVTPEAIVAGLVFAAIMGVVGGFLPALRAARQPIAASLRGA